VKETEIPCIHEEWNVFEIFRVNWNSTADVIGANVAFVERHFRRGAKWNNRIILCIRKESFWLLSILASSLYLKIFPLFTKIWLNEYPLSHRGNKPNENKKISKYLFAINCLRYRVLLAYTYCLGSRNLCFILRCFSNKVTAVYDNKGIKIANVIF